MHLGIQPQVISSIVSTTDMTNYERFNHCLDFKPVGGYKGSAGTGNGMVHDRNNGFPALLPNGVVLEKRDVELGDLSWRKTLPGGDIEARHTTSAKIQ